MAKIELHPEQRAHVERIKGILKHSRTYVDTSMVGAGKTYVSLYVAAATGRDIIVVCPLNVVRKWEALAHQYGVGARVLTYQALALNSCELSKQLVRAVHPPCYRAGPGVPSNCMLIVDEFHYVTHETQRTRAVFALAGEVAKKGGIVSWLSATAFTKESELISFVKRLKQEMGGGFVQAAHRLQARALVDACDARMSEDVACCVSQLMDVTPLDVFKGISSRVHKPGYSFATLDIQDCVCEIDDCVDEDEESGDDNDSPQEIKRKKRRLSTVYDVLTAIRTAIARYRRNNDLPPDEAELIMMKITNKYMCILESMKVECFVHHVRETAYSHKNIVFVNYNKSVTEIMNELKDLNPLHIGGDVSAKARESVINRFNTDSSIRLLVCNTKATCIGIDLNDKIGHQPRAAYISPSFDYSSMLQAIGRVYRIDSKSMPIVRLLYVIGTKTTNGKVSKINEQRLLNNMRRKADFVRSFGFFD